MGQLDGKVAVITGGSAGIGAATARCFVSEGATVFVTGLDQAGLDATVKEINAQNNGGQAIGVRGDVSSLGDLDQLYARVKDQSGHIDVLFANAGVGGMARLGDITEEQFDRVFGINVRGLVFTVQKALPLLPDGASIILPASINASTATEAMSVYSATKAAVRNFARTWALELADRHIRVNAISPGPIKTGFVDATDPTKAEDLWRTLLARMPLGRLGEPEEVAAAALFLATRASSFTTGAEIFVDGGFAQV
jgi:NAD(P)-dependent dehydrogenase (short-subunit alcohol dehydrogenase family)